MNNRTIEYDIHGIVGIRLVNPSEGDAAAVAKQLGPLRGSLDRAPDIVIQFEKKIPISSLKYLGLDWAGYTDEGFYVLRSSKMDAKVRIPFEKIGNTCAIVCESGLRSIPLLLAIINLTFLNVNFNRNRVRQKDETQPNLSRISYWMSCLPIRLQRQNKRG